MIAWIKVETTLPQKLELLKLSLRLRIPRREAIGLCIEFWLWADSVAREDGVLRSRVTVYLPKPGEIMRTA